jgi:hypothetical protein
MLVLLQTKYFNRVFSDPVEKIQYYILFLYFIIDTGIIGINLNPTVDRKSVITPLRSRIPKYLNVLLTKKILDSIMSTQYSIYWFESTAYQYSPYSKYLILVFVPQDMKN